MLIVYKNLEVKKRCDKCAERAAAVMKFYKDNGGIDDPLDLLVDLMHLARREGVDFQAMLDAEFHFIAEVEQRGVRSSLEARQAGSCRNVYDCAAESVCPSEDAAYACPKTSDC